MSRPPGLIALASLALALLNFSCGQDAPTKPASHALELDSPYLLGATTGSENYIHIFANAGNYPYHCRLHSTADHREGGAVFVTAQAPESAFVSIFEGIFRPDTVTVRVNGSVRWQNFDDGTHHTVTSD